eukprot:5510415-Prymnesium_polylepis.1
MLRWSTEMLQAQACARRQADCASRCDYSCTRNCRPSARVPRLWRGGGSSRARAVVGRLRRFLPSDPCGAWVACSGQVAARVAREGRTER